MEKTIVFVLAIIISINAIGQEIKVKKKGGLSGFFIGKEQVIDYKYDQVDYMPAGYFLVSENGLVGVVSEEGVEVIPCVYDSITEGSIEDYIIYKDGLSGIIDHDGAQLLELKYDEIQYYDQDSVSLVKFEGKWCILKDSQYIYDINGVLFSKVDQMPLFPGCMKDGIAPSEVQSCSYRKMLEYVYSNIKYPKTARKEKIEGTVVISFTITATGEIQSAKIARAIGGGCEEEAMRVVNSMPGWIPARHDGMTVATRFNLPVKFKLAR